MTSINTRLLHQTVCLIDLPYLYDSLWCISFLIFQGSSTSDEMLIRVHNLGISVHTWMLFLSLLDAFIVHVIEQEISLNIYQKSIVILLELPACPDTLKLFNNSLFTNYDFVTAFTFLFQFQLYHSCFFSLLIGITHNEPIKRDSLHAFRDAA